MRRLPELTVRGGCEAIDVPLLKHGGGKFSHYPGVGKRKPQARPFCFNLLAPQQLLCVVSH